MDQDRVRIPAQYTIVPDTGLVGKLLRLWLVGTCPCPSVRVRLLAEPTRLPDYPLPSPLSVSPFLAPGDSRQGPSPDTQPIVLSRRRMHTPLDRLEERLSTRCPPGPVTDQSAELLQGTLEMLVLKALSLEPMHGWGIGHRIEQWSGDVFRVSQGSLYPALQRMIRKGWINSEWRTTDNNRRGRYYLLTRAGRRQLETETTGWERAVAAITGILAQPQPERI